MLPYYYYWQASRRLEESLKTVKAMEPDVPPMVQAQYDMIEREVEYYREESDKFTIFLLTLLVFCVSLGYLIDKGIIDVYKIIG